MAYIFGLTINVLYHSWKDFQTFKCVSMLVSFYLTKSSLLVYFQFIVNTIIKGLFGINKGSIKPDTFSYNTNNKRHEEVFWNILWIKQKQNTLISKISMRK